MTPLPTHILAGYLGAGKTTTLNHLLRHAQGQRLAVLVNDFGEVNIDAALVEGADGDVLALAGGCICCAYGADLLSTLRHVTARQPRPDALIIECSGVALPAAVARTARLAAEVDVQAIVVLADAQTARERAADRFVGDVVMQQLQAADLVLLNKTDELDEAALADCLAWLHAQLPGTPVLPGAHGQWPPEVVLGPRAVRTHDEHQPTRMLSAASGITKTHTEQPFVAELQQHAASVVLDELVAELTAPEARVLRAKGFVQAVDGFSYLLQLVGSRATWRPAPAPAGLLGQLVVIRRR